MPINSDQIDLARKSGYSDDEIYDHLAKTSPEFQKAKEAGYSLHQVRGFLSNRETLAKNTRQIESDYVAENTPAVVKDTYKAIGEAESSPKSKPEDKGAVLVSDSGDTTPKETPYTGHEGDTAKTAMNTISAGAYGAVKGTLNLGISSLAGAIAGAFTAGWGAAPTFIAANSLLGIGEGAMESRMPERTQNIMDEHATAKSVGEFVPMAAMGVQGIKGLLELPVKQAIGRAGVAAGAGALMEGIRPPIEAATAKLTGGDAKDTEPATMKSILMAAVTNSVFGGLHEPLKVSQSQIEAMADGKIRPWQVLYGKEIPLTKEQRESTEKRISGTSDKLLGGLAANEDFAKANPERHGLVLKELNKRGLKKPDGIEDFLTDQVAQYQKEQQQQQLAAAGLTKTAETLQKTNEEEAIPQKAKPTQKEAAPTDAQLPAGQREQTGTPGGEAQQRRVNESEPAVYTNPETGEVTTGANHMEAAAKQGVTAPEERTARETPEYGIQLEDGSIVSREEAASLAKQTGQLPEGSDVTKLHSDDLVKSPADTRDAATGTATPGAALPKLPDVNDKAIQKSSVMSLGITPGYVDVKEPIVQTLNKVKAIARTANPKEEWSKLRNVFENKAGLFARQKTNDLRDELGLAMGRKSKAPLPIDEQALGQLVEAGGTREGLQELQAKVEGKTSSEAVKLRKAIEHAQANFDRLRTVESAYRDLAKKQVELERENGLDTPEHDNYVPHYQEQEAGMETPFSAGSVSSAFMKERIHSTFADSVAAGVKPKSLNAIDLLESRIRRGMRYIGQQKWVESGKELKDPTTGNPLVTDLVKIERKSGKTELVAPRGYVTKNIGGHTVAVNEGYSGFFNAITGSGFLGNSVAGRAAAMTSGTLKHGLLLFDTFHLGRLAAYEAGFALGSGEGLKGVQYKRPLLLIEHTEGALRKMADRGELPKEDLPGILEHKRKSDLLIDQGLNVGGIQEAMFSGWIRNSPLTKGNIGRFNKFLFEKFQRGAMVQSGRIVMEQYLRDHPEWTERQAAREAVKDVNTRFGNLQKESWVKSRSAQEIMQLAFLAPSWNEGLIRSELRGYKQIGHGAVQSVAQKQLVAGGLARNMMALTLGTFAANQIINYVTRRNFTWENPEEGVDSKISAYIPDVIGGGPGFFLNPMALPLEYTEQLMAAHESTGNWIKASARVAGYKIAPAMRALDIVRTGKNPMGKPVNTYSEYAKEIASVLNPAPIPGKALANAASSLANKAKGESEGDQPSVTEDFQGQIEKQIFASFGVKLQGAPTNVQRIAKLASNFKDKEGIEKKEFGQSDYTTLQKYLAVRNYDDAKKEIQRLLESKTMDQIQSHFVDYPRRNTMPSKALEQKFISSLNPEQLKAYDKAKAEKEIISDRFEKMDKSGLKEYKETSKTTKRKKAAWMATSSLPKPPKP